MTKRSPIQAVDIEAEEAGDTETVTYDPSIEFEEEVYEEWEEEPATRSWRWVAPCIAILAIAAWTAFFVWTYRMEIGALPSPERWTTLITQWAIPVLLVVSLWLLAMRNSTREANRYAEVAQSLSRQSIELETRLSTVNRELSLAREFLATQTKELDFLGRSATERLSEHADKLQALIGENGEQVDSIASVSITALENMDRLRDNLPVVANSAKDVSNQIGNAGRTAQGQLSELIGGFERLNEFGAASERQVDSLRKRVDAALDAFSQQTDQMGTVAEQRFAALRDESEAFRGDLDSREVEALASIRNRFDALRTEINDAEAVAADEREAAMADLRNSLDIMRTDADKLSQTVREGEQTAIETWTGQVEAMQERLTAAIAEISRIDEEALGRAQAKLRSLFEEAETVDDRIAERNRLFDEEVSRRQAEFSEAEDAARIQLFDRLSLLDEEITKRRTAQTEQLETMAREGEALGERIAVLGETFETVSGQGREAQGAVSDGIDALNSKLVESREALDSTDMAVAALTDASVRLLELIQASAKHGREDIPAAMEASEERLIEIERRVDDVKALLDQARVSGEGLTSAIGAADERSKETITAVDDFQARFGETAAAQVAGIERLRASVAALGDENAAVAERAQGELRDAIAALETSAREALSAIETDQADRIAKIAEKVGGQSAEAIDRALSEQTVDAIAKLNEATEKSSEAGREVTRQLRDQLAKVNELTGNLESRIAHARDRASEDVDNDFSRRVALITESLNSSAIDIAKVLSTDVTDTAWASYLKGDRGIFTRRAVRLLDNTEAREIAELYDTDRDFREHVSRYIHDFEAMLRTMLSTRDGHAVSVTLLSSDMGKLYVVLAQALERLRQ